MICFILFVFNSQILKADNPIIISDSSNADEMWSKDQYRLFVVKSDSSFSFTKNDETLVDYIAGKWMQRADSFYFYSNDTFRILYFIVKAEDSIHRKLVHIDPRIYDSYQGNFPTYLYLTKTFYENGKLHKEFDFIKNGDLSEEPEQLKIQCFTPRGLIDYALTINLKSNTASYVAYLQNEHVYPKEIIYGTFKNGIKKGLWYFNEFDISGTKLLKTRKIVY